MSGDTLYLWWEVALERPAFPLSDFGLAVDTVSGHGTRHQAFLVDVVATGDADANHRVLAPRRRICSGEWPR